MILRLFLGAWLERNNGIGEDKRGREGFRSWGDKDGKREQSERWEMGRQRGSMPVLEDKKRKRENRRTANRRIIVCFPNHAEGLTPLYASCLWLLRWCRRIFGVCIYVWRQH